MDKDKEKESEVKAIDIKEATICDATAQMLRKAERDGVETAFHRAANMKACPIGAESACCKHCSMGPCRLNSADPYGKVGVCGARLIPFRPETWPGWWPVACAAHTDHGMSMLDLFREVVSGHNLRIIKSKTPIKLNQVAQAIGIETEGQEHQGYRHGPL